MKSDRIFIIHFTISLIILVTLIKGRLDLSWISALLLGLIFFQLFPATIAYVRNFAHGIGQVNSLIILGLTYFFIFTPFGFIYRLVFSAQTFKHQKTRWIDSNSEKNFDTPY